MTPNPPRYQLHRYRQTQAIRDWVAETRLVAADFILPIFINETLSQRVEIPTMPGCFQESPDSLVEEVEQAVRLGIKAVILFGIPTQKNEFGSAASDQDGVIQAAIRTLKSKCPELIVIADCCLCEYTDHGHCYVQNGHGIDLASTLNRLKKIAVSYAQAGVDIVAPSGRMDGMVTAIRMALDEAHYQSVSVMSYSVKMASQFYGPFRDAAGSLDHFKGDRKTHQINPTQRREALREVDQDIAQGADYLIVKPALPNLDLIREVRNRVQVPIIAYSVSGEYAMLKAAAKAGIVDELNASEEIFLSMKRAGADMIISYYAPTFIQNRLNP